MLMLSFGTASMLNAQKPEIITSDKKGWHKIGENTVNFKTDRDEILVIGADKFRSILFRVSEAPIHLVRANISYESGDGEDISLDFPVQVAGESRIVNLNGGERSIKKITFVYHTLPNRRDEKAHVEIWGLKTNYDKNSR